MGTEQMRRERPRSRAEAERLRRQRELVRRKRRRAKCFMRIAVFCLFGCMVFFLVSALKNRGQKEIPHRIDPKPGMGQDLPVTAAGYNGQNLDETGEDVSGIALDTRRILQDEEVEEQLLALAAENRDIAEIYQNRDSYPEELLKALSLNPEMLDFVKGYLDADGSVTGGFTEEEMEQEFPLLLQWDSRWGYYSYGGSNIGIAGCGPTCLSMVILALTGNERATPDVLADYSMDYGHYVAGTGTAWTLMTEAPGLYGVSVSELGLDEEAMKWQLDNGGMIICAMRPGDFTTAGHFIVIYGYDAEGFMVNDPNSRERSKQRWPYDDIWYQIKNLWSFR